MEWVGRTLPPQQYPLLSSLAQIAVHSSSLLAAYSFIWGVWLITGIGFAPWMRLLKRGMAVQRHQGVWAGDRGLYRSNPNSWIFPFKSGWKVFQIKSWGPLRLCYWGARRHSQWQHGSWLSQTAKKEGHLRPAPVSVQWFLSTQKERLYPHRSPKLAWLGGLPPQPP